MTKKLKPGEFYTKEISPCYTEPSENIAFADVNFKVEETIRIEKSEMDDFNAYDVGRYN